MISIRLHEDDYETIIDGDVTVVEFDDDDEVTIELDSDEAWLLKTEGTLETVCRETDRDVSLMSPGYDEED